MGKPLMLRDEDHAQLERLKKRLKRNTKITVLRDALELLERESLKHEMRLAWKKAAQAAAASSTKVLSDFHSSNPFKRDK